MNSVRGDDDVLALLDEMGGGIGGGVIGAPPPVESPPGRRRHRASASSSSSSSAASSATAAAATSNARRGSDPPPLGDGDGVDPLVEIARRRCHERFKAGFYDRFRSCCFPPPASSSAPPASSSTTSTSTSMATIPETRGGGGKTADDVVRSIIASTWPSIPPHAVWERYQFSLKALEADCVREAADALYAGSAARAGARGRSGRGAPPTAREALERILSGRRLRGPPVWEPLLPVPSVFDEGDDVDDAGGGGGRSSRTTINAEYRGGTLTLLRGEVEFQFRRSFRGGGGRRGGGKGGRGRSELRGMRASLLGDGGGDATSVKMTMKKDEGGKLAATTTTTTTTTHDGGDDGDDDDEEIVLRTIFESRPFQQITQKLHRRFHALAGEWHSAFLSELRKLSNRSIVEEEQQQRGRRDGGGRMKRKRGRNGGPDRGVPRIAPAENRVDEDDADVIGGGSGGGGGGGGGDDRQLAVSFFGIALRINEPHEAKLRSMYRRALLDRRRAGGGERDDVDDVDDGDRVDELLRCEYPRLLFSLLLRYDALEGAGLQSAVPRAVFRYLRTRFGRGVFECFASPFNCNWSGGGSSDDDDGPGGGGAAAMGGRYGSAFPDTDAPFGSAGSFFDLDFSNGGCFQANPPFAPEFIERMCRRMHQFLTTTDNSPGEGGIPLMFVVVVPAWSDSAGYRMLETSPRVMRHVLLSQRDDVHYYAEGTQHRRRCGNGDGGGHRIASFDTSVFFLQNHAARELWPLRDDDGSMLKDAFAMNPVEGEGTRGSGRDDGIRGEKSTRDRKVGMPSALSGPRNQSGNTASSSTERGRETKEARPVGKSKRRSSKKKKLMTGGQDELNILASMGILDAGPVRAGKAKTSAMAQTASDGRLQTVMSQK